MEKVVNKNWEYVENNMTSRHNVSPIEVKSGKNYTFSSQL